MTKTNTNWNRKKCKRRPRRSGVDRTCPAITITPMAFWPYGDNIDEDNPWKSFYRSIQNRPRRWSIFRAMQCRWFIFQQRCNTDYFWEKGNIAIVAFIFLDHRERLFFDYFAHLHQLFCDYSLTYWDHQKGSYTRNQMQRDFLPMYNRLKIYFA